MIERDTLIVVEFEGEDSLQWTPGYFYAMDESVVAYTPYSEDGTIHLLPWFIINRIVAAINEEGVARMVDRIEQAEMDEENGGWLEEELSE